MEPLKTKRAAHHFVVRSPFWERGELHALQRLGAVSYLVDVDTHLLDHRKKQVGRRRVVRIPQRTSTFHVAAGAADNSHGKPNVVMQVRIAQTAADKKQRILQYRVVALFDRVELVEEVRRLLH